MTCDPSLHSPLTILEYIEILASREYKSSLLEASRPGSHTGNVYYAPLNSLVQNMGNKLRSLVRAGAYCGSGQSNQV